MAYIKTKDTCKCNRCAGGGQGTAPDYLNAWHCTCPCHTLAGDERVEFVETNRKKMRIALDYDDTFTNDEVLWTKFVELAKSRGHSVDFVTFRREADGNRDILTDAKALGLDITFCNGKQKASQFKADIWIDDSPRFIPTAEDIKYQIENYDLQSQLSYIDRHQPLELPAQTPMNSAEQKHKAAMKAAEALREHLQMTYTEGSVGIALNEYGLYELIVYIIEKTDPLQIPINQNLHTFQNYRVQYHEIGQPTAD